MGLHTTKTGLLCPKHLALCPQAGQSGHPVFGLLRERPAAPLPVLAGHLLSQYFVPFNPDLLLVPLSSWVVSPRSHGIQTFVLEQWTFVQSKSYLRVPGSTV